MHWLDKDGAICIQWPQQPRWWLPWNSDRQGKILTGLAADSCYNLQPAQFLIVFYFMTLTSLLSQVFIACFWYFIPHFWCKFVYKGQNLIPLDQLELSIHLFQISIFPRWLLQWRGKLILFMSCFKTIQTCDTWAEHTFLYLL